MSAITTLPAPATRRRRKEARPQELLDAALELFVEKGFAATRAEEVALRAGVSKGTLYLYYPSKEELFKAVITHHVSARIADSAQRVDAYRGRMGPLLQDMLVAWWQQVYASPASGTFKIIISEVRNFPEIAEFYVHEVVEPGQRLIGDLLRRGIERGEFRAVDVDVTAHLLAAPMLMISLWRNSLEPCCDDRIDPQALLDAHVEMLSRGLARSGT